MRCSLCTLRTLRRIRNPRIGVLGSLSQSGVADDQPSRLVKGRVSSATAVQVSENFPTPSEGSFGGTIPSLWPPILKFRSAMQSTI